MPFFQAKLTVNQPGDPQEKEADAVADQVMRMPENHTRQSIDGSQPVQIQRMASQQEEEPEVQRMEEEQEAPVQRKEMEQEEPLQRKEEAEQDDRVQAKLQSHPIQPPAQFAARLQALQSGGAPLPQPFRNGLETQIGFDFSRVRIHTDARAAELSQDIRARAFTHREHIFFNTGQFAPESGVGRFLLAHELTHTIQQTGGTPLPAQSNASEETNASPVPSVSETVAAVPAEEQQSAVQNTEIQPVVKGIAPEGTAEGTPEPQPEVPAAPQHPSEDPAFQTVTTQVGKTATAQKDHVEPEIKVGGARKAALLTPAEQSLQQDQDAHMGKMEQTKPPEEFKAEDFEKLLDSEIEKIEKELPHTESESKRFVREKPLEQVKQNIQGKVTNEKTKVAGPMAAEAATTQPPATNSTTEQPEGLTEEKSGKKPKGIDPKSAAPKPKADHEISMQKESDSLDELMVEQDVTEEQFAESNEPKITQTLELKQQAQAEAAAAPVKYREEEAKVLGTAQAEAGQKGHSGLGAMYAARTGAFGQVFTGQTTAKNDDHTAQTTFKDALAKIYQDTKKDVATILDTMSTEVQTYFETGINTAKGEFEKRVEKQLEDIHGWGVKDFFFGEDTEAIESVFRREKQIFLDKMRITIRETAKKVATGLNDAMKRIQQGRKDAAEKYGTLTEAQKKASADAYSMFDTQFNDLEETVQDNKRELASSLADMYVQNVSTLRETFNKINEEARLNWIQKAARAIKEIAMAIYKLGELIVKTLIRIAYLVGDIIKHPIRFIESLAGGIKDGVSNFIGRIDVHLKEAFFKWITGAAGNTGIVVPASFDLKSLFGFALQLVGLTYTNVRNMIAIKFGEAKVAFIEKAIAAGEKGLEIFTLIRRGSFAELWEHLKEYLGNQISEAFEQIKQTVLYTVVEKAIKWLAGLFMPAGAFFKAAMAIYAGLRWLADNINRIIDIVNAFLDSMELATKGQTAKIADKIEKILASGLILVIDFLAKLLNLGDLVKKVKSVLDKIRKPIERAIKWLLGKIKPFVDKLWKMAKGVVDKTKTFAKNQAGKLVEWWKTRKGFKDKTGHAHQLYFKKKGKKYEMIVESNPQNVKDMLAGLKPGIVDPAKISAAKDLADWLETTNETDAKKIEAQMTKLAVLLADIMSVNQNKPDGTINNPYWIKWHKDYSLEYPSVVLRPHPGAELKPLRINESQKVIIWKDSVKLLKDIKFIKGQLLKQSVAIANFYESFGTNDLKGLISRGLQKKKLDNDLKSLRSRIAARIIEIGDNLGSRTNKERRRELKKDQSLEKDLQRLLDTLRNYDDLLKGKLAKLKEIGNELKATEEKIKQLASGEQEEKIIGVQARNLVGLNSILGPSVKSPRSGYESKYHLFLKAAGLENAEKLSGDHVTELSLSGPDKDENLWPYGHNVMPYQEISDDTGKQFDVDEWTPPHMRGKKRAMNMIKDAYFIIKGKAKKGGA